MAQWAASQDDEQQQGAGEPHTPPTNKNGLSSNDEIPHPLMDCGQGKNKNNDKNYPATGRILDEVGIGVDVVSEMDDGRVSRASDGEDDATGNNNAEDVPKAIAGIN